MAKQAPWDDQTDLFIEDLDELLSKKYDVPFRGLLMTPDKYLTRKDIGETASAIKDDVESYFSGLLTDLKDEQTKLISEMESITLQYNQVDSVIANKSAAARIPYIKPMLVTRDPDKEETIVIGQYNETLESFIGKLVTVSNYVADVSTVYKQYYLGSWLFSGQKNHVLTINPPDSPVLVIENSRQLIEGILDDIQSRASQ